MKRIKSILGIGLLGLILTGCGGGSAPKNNSSVHEHTYSAFWSYDKTYHWHASTCGHPEEIKDKEEHSFGDWVIDSPATEYNKGRKHKSCSKCDYRIDEEIDLLEHTHKAGNPVKENIVNATCTESGSYDLVTYCRECLEELSRTHKIVDSLGHDYESETFDPTYERDGYIVYTCSRCGDTYQEKGESKLTHTYSEEWSVDEENGTHYHACLDEGYTDLRKDEGTHIFSNWEAITEATDYTDGLEEATCTVCGEHKQRTVDSYMNYCKKNLLNLSYEYISGWNRYGYVLNSIKDKNVERIIVPMFCGANDFYCIKVIGTGAFKDMPNLKEIILRCSLYEVRADAFSNCPKLESVVFAAAPGQIDANSGHLIGGPEAVIRTNAFRGCYLKKIEIPRGFGIIEAGALNTCYNLEELTLPFVGSSDSATGDNEFFEKIFGHVEFENSVDFVHNYGTLHYYVPASLKKVTIIGGVVGDKAFYNSPCIEEIILGNKVTEYGTHMISGCPSLKKVSLSENVLEWTQGGVVSNNPLLESISIPEGVTSIGGFSYNGMITELKLPSTLLKMNEYSFCGLTSLKRIEIPEGVNEIGGFAFKDCSSLEEVIFPKNLSSIRRNAFENCSSLKEIEIPNNVKEILFYTFMNCSSLQRVVLPEGLTRIHEKAFYKCTSLTECNLPSTLAWIDSGAFYECNLSTIIIPDALKTFSQNAFYGNVNVTLFDLGNSTFSPEFLLHYSNTFEYKVSENNTAYTVVDGILFNKEGNKICRYPGKKTDKEYIISESIVEINSCCFDGAENLESIMISNSVKKIGWEAFGSCINLTELIIPNSVTEIGSSAFSDCDKLVEMTIPDSVTTLESSAFSQCENLKKVTLGNGIKTLEMLFYGSYSLEEVVLPSSLTYIKNNVFHYNDKLVEIIYQGTRSQWSKITKESNWKVGSSLKRVVCTDGTVSV